MKLTVSLVPAKTCLVNVPRFFIEEFICNSASTFGERCLLLLEWNGASVVTAWSGEVTKSRKIEIDSTFARYLNIDEGLEVDVSFMSKGDLKATEEVVVEPDGVEDWELIELNVEFLEKSILNQVAAVRAGRTIPIWMNPSLRIVLHVVRTKPEPGADEYLLLTSKTEIVIIPKPRFQNSANPPVGKKRTGKKVFRIQGFLKDSHTTVLLCNPHQMARWGWLEGQLVQLLPTLSINYNSAVFLRLFGHEKIFYGHAIVHVGVAMVLGVGRFSRIILRSVIREEFVNVKCLALKYLEPERGRSANIPRVNQVLGPLNDWLKSNSSFGRSKVVTDPLVHTGISNPACVPLTNGTVISLEKFGIYRIFCNIQKKTDYNQNLGSNQNFFVDNTKDQLENRVAKMANPRGVRSLGATGDGVEDTVISAESQGEMSKHDDFSSHLDRESRMMQQQSLDDRLFLVAADFEFDDQNVVVGEESESVKQKMTVRPNDFFESVKPKMTVRSNDFFEPWLVADDQLPSPIDLVGGLDSQISQCRRHLTACLSFHAIKNQICPFAGGVGGLMLYGPHGSGKTMLSLGLAYDFQSDTEFLSHAIRVSCSELSGSSVVNVRRIIDRNFQEALNRQPTLMIWDDLDLLFPSQAPEENRSWQYVAHTRSLIDAFLGWCHRVRRERHLVAIICTGQREVSLASEIGHPSIFTLKLACGVPGFSERQQILKKLLLKKRLKFHSDLNFSELASKTDGYLGSDLERLVEGTAHKASLQLLEKNVRGKSLNRANAMAPDFFFNGQRNPDPEKFLSVTKNLELIRLHLYITTEDFMLALKEFEPVALRGIRTPKSTSPQRDVGGLEAVRQSLRETILWPQKYNFLFKQAPIRHRSGILLFGPGGCGKTSLVHSIVAEFEMNFLSVNGPEILNKYIGQSEQNIRDIFTRAQSAAPCILFFDEFDSIAPKRGHDNTSVTDRIVNQILTEMDGIERLEGVYILAATNRPDLIDPALLRPGRLDKCHYIGVPDIHDRLSILKTLSRNINLNADVDLQKLAEMTESYTGADLRALLYNSQLLAIHQNLDPGDPKKMPLSTPFTILHAPTHDPPSNRNQRQTIKCKLKTIAKNLLLPHHHHPQTPEKLPEKLPVSVSKTHIENALSQLMISPKLKKMDAIYSTFISSSGSEFSITQEIINNQRETLA